MLNAGIKRDGPPQGGAHKLVKPSALIHIYRQYYTDEQLHLGIYVFVCVSLFVCMHVIKISKNRGYEFESI